MSEILIASHNEAFITRGNRVFGNKRSPLTRNGRGEQAQRLRSCFRTEYGIVPETYERPVLASEFTRAKQTARWTGFGKVAVSPLINEAVIPKDMRQRGAMTQKHAAEHWVPNELQDRVAEFLVQVRSGELGYSIYFAHRFFIAGVTAALATEYEERDEVSPYIFDAKRGYMPKVSSISAFNLDLPLAA